MEFSWQEYWSGLTFPSLGDLPDLGIKAGSPNIAGGVFTIWATRKPKWFLLFSHSVVSNSLLSYWLQQARLSCPSPSPRVWSNSCPLNQWRHPVILSSVILFSSCLQSFPHSGSFQMSQFFASGVQSIGTSASASVFPMNIQGWFPLRLTGWISLQSKELSRVFSNITVQKHQFFGTQLSL